ncbi:unnamed protein product [Camellia sinensis]
MAKSISSHLLSLQSIAISIIPGKSPSICSLNLCVVNFCYLLLQFVADNIEFPCVFTRKIKFSTSFFNDFGLDWIGLDRVIFTLLSLNFVNLVFHVFYLN